MRPVVKTPPESVNYVGPMIYGAITMAAVTIAAVVTIAILRPDNASVITTVIGISSPVILGLMAVGLQGIHKLTNSNLSSVKEDLQQALMRIEDMHDRNMGRRLSDVDVVPAPEAIPMKVEVVNEPTDPVPVKGPRQ